MQSYKKYIPVIIIVLPVIIAILIRGKGTGHFKYDAERWAESSINGRNIITPERLAGLNGKILVVNLSGTPYDLPGKPDQIIISPDSALSRTVLRKAGNNRGAVILWSDDPAISARIWMLMSQTGIKDLYILRPDTLNESIKEKFRADTLTSPEL